jgi:hypothetical protein
VIALALLAGVGALGCERTDRTSELASDGSALVDSPQTEATSDAGNEVEAGSKVEAGDELESGDELEVGTDSSAGGRQPEAGTGIAHIEVVNTTGSTLYAFYWYDTLGIDGNPALEWLRIGSPELALVTFGVTACDGGPHNDPLGKSVWAVPPGSRIAYDWNGLYAAIVGATSQNPCFTRAYAPSGTYPARACARTSDPSFEAGQGPIAQDAGADRCVDLMVTLPAAGTVTSSAVW